MSESGGKFCHLLHNTTGYMREGCSSMCGRFPLIVGTAVSIKGCQPSEGPGLPTFGVLKSLQR